MCDHIFSALYNVELLSEEPNTNRMLQKSIVARSSKY